MKIKNSRPSNIVRFVLGLLILVVFVSCSMSRKSKTKDSEPPESSKFKIFYLALQWDASRAAGSSPPVFVLNSMHTFNHSDESILKQEFYVTGVFNILQQPLAEAVQETTSMFALYVRVGRARFESLARKTLEKYGEDSEVKDLVEKLGSLMDSFDEFIAEQLKAIDKT